MLHRPADADLAISTGRGNLAAGLTPKATGRFRTRTLTSPLALALEPRFMFDAAGVATGGEAAVDAAAQEAADQQTDNPQPEPDTDPLAEALSVTAPPADRKEIVFVDPNIQNVDALLAGVHPAAQVVVLTPGGDGLQQIADYMADQADIDAVHILSHGQEGGVRLGGMVLDLARVESRAAELTTIGDALSANADILIYGCDVAANAAGQAFVDALAQATGADVAASTDDTGHTDQGGDWDLEVTTGAIEAAVVLDAEAQTAFQGRLATLTVTTAVDELDDIDGLGTVSLQNFGGADDLSLREALALAAAGDIITFDNTVTAIQLNAVANGGLGELVIAKAMTIDGDLDDDGIADVILDGGDTTQVLSVAGGTTGVALDGLVIRDGRATDGGGLSVAAGADVAVTNSQVLGNYTTSRGGGIFNAGTLSLTDVTVGDNRVGYLQFGNDGDAGGGIANTGTLTVANSTIRNNFAEGNSVRGGGIDNRGTLTVIESTIINNTAIGDTSDSVFGGGIANTRTATVLNSTVSANFARYGGGIYTTTALGVLTVVNSTIAGNDASNGGGILIGTGTVTVVNSTLSGNEANATDGGGGIENRNGRLALRNSIVAGNEGGPGPDIRNTGTVTSNGANIFGSDVAGSAAGDIELGVNNGYTLTDVFATVGADPSTGVTAGLLGDNGGPTRTIAINLAGLAADGGITTDLPTELALNVDVDGIGGIEGAAISVDQRGFARTLGGAVDIGAVESPAGTLASVVVDTVVDEVDGDFSQADLSLREALALVAAGGTITFDPDTFPTDTTRSVIQLNAVASGGLGELLIAKAVTIDGDIDDDGVADVILDGGDTTRVLSVTAGTTGVALDGLVIRDGRADLGGGLAVGVGAEVAVNHSHVLGSFATTRGGGIYNDGTLSLTSVTVASNVVGSFQTGIFGDEGGGIHNGGTLTVTNSTIRNNFVEASSGAEGGGIRNSGTLTVLNSAISDNVLIGGGTYGGGIHNSGNATVVNSTVDGNTAGEGGGIRTSGTLTVINSTLSDNNGSSAGGGIWNDGTAKVVNSTISGNSTDNKSGRAGGGGIMNNLFGNLTVVNSTISGNINGSVNELKPGSGIYNRSSLTLRNSIVAGNAGDSDADIRNNSTLISNGANIFGSDVAGDVAGDIELGVNNGFTLADVFANVGDVFVGGQTFQAGLLGDNGGPTQTIAINPIGLAADAGITADLPTELALNVDVDGIGGIEDAAISVDQRGLARTLGGAVDIGAVESPANSLASVVVDTVVDEFDSDFSEGDLSLREALMLVAPGGTITFDPDVFPTDGIRSVIQLNAEANGGLGQLFIGKAVTIDGDLDDDGVADVAIDGGGTTRVFNLTSDAIDVLLDGLVVRNGWANEGGGLVLQAGADVTLTNSVLHGNEASSTGGGIINLGSLSVTNSRIHGNEASSAGGGIYNRGSLSVQDTEVFENQATGAFSSGGGIFNLGDATVVNSTIAENSAQAGAGLFNAVTATLVNTTISGNSTAALGGSAVSNGGGGIYNGSLGDLTLVNATVSGNVNRDGPGGGINNEGNLTLRNSIVAGNGGNGDPEIRNTGTVTSNGANLFGSGVDDSATAAGDIELGVGSASNKTLTDVFANVGTDPNTGVTAGLLGDNGGPTRTIAINPTGLAVDAGITTDLPTEQDLDVDVDGNGNTDGATISVDQLGLVRTLGGAVDIGAVESPANSLASVLVDTVVDEVDGNFSKGDVSLREALILVAPGGTIAFDPGVFPSAGSRATIGLDAALGDLVIAKGVTIDGDINDDGIADVIVSGNGATRVFNVTGGTPGVTLDGLVIRDGRAGEGGGLAVGAGADVTVTNSRIIRNEAISDGGGLAVGAGADVTVMDSQIANNVVEFDGAGIHNAGNLSLQNSSVSVNYATYSFSNGGGIFNTRSGNLTLTNVSIGRNTAGAEGYAGAGGGIFNAGIASVVNSTISANRAQYGGGMFNRGTATLVNATISGNTAKESYAPPPYSYASRGGGIYNRSNGSLTLVNTTISGNVGRDGPGGGIDNRGGLTLSNSIVAGNAASSAAEIHNLGTVTSNGANIFGGDVAESVTAAGDIELGVGNSYALADIFASVGGNPSTGVASGLLADNGGPTPTIALNSLGIAVNAGSNDSLSGLGIDVTGDGNPDDPIPVDQRGLTRVQSGTVDIGAYEAQLPFAQDDAVTTDEDTVLDGNVLAANGGTADSDPEGNPLSVVAVNDQAGDVGQPVTLPSGALLRLNADGTFTYDPNGRFEGLAAGQTATDSFTYIIGNGIGGLARATVTVTITGVDDAPTLAATGQDPTFTEDGSPAGLFGGVTASTVDAGQTFSGLTLTVTNVGDGAGEILHIDGSDVALTDGTMVTTAANGITVTVSVSGSTATVSASGASLSAAALQSLVDGLTYRNASDDPTTGSSRVVTITQVTDSGSDISPNDNAAALNLASTVSLTAVNDAPVVGAPGAALAVTEQVGLNIHGAGFTVSDVDAGGGQVTATLSVGEGAILVAAGNSGVTITNGNNSGTVTLTGTIAQIDALLTGAGTGTIVYTNPSDTPSADTPFTVTVNDQGNTGNGGAQTESASQTITIQAVNDAPVVGAPGATLNAIEQVGLNIHGTGFTLSDVDAGDGQVTATLSVGEGTILVTAGNSGVTITNGNNTDAVTLTGTIAQIDALLTGAGTGTIVYTNPSDAPSADTPFTVTVNDQGNTGSGGAQTVSASQTIAIQAVNDAPVVGAPGTALAATEQVGLAIHGAGFTVSDVDAGGGQVTATLSVGEGTILVAAGNSGVTITNGNNSNAVTLTGTIAQIDALLTGAGTGTIVYTNPSDTPSANTPFTVTVNDEGNTGNGGDQTASASQTITITAVNDSPFVAMDFRPLTATEQVGLNIQGILLSDADAADGPATATLSVGEGIITVAVGDSGVAVTGGNNSNSVTLTGTIAQLANLLNGVGTGTVVYTNTSDTPSASTTYTVTVNDQGNTGSGGAQTASASRTINITAVNDAPVVAGPDTALAATEQVGLNIHGTGFTVSDVDAGGGQVTATLSVGEGTILVAAGNSGVAITNGNNTGTVTLAGTIAQIDALLTGAGTGTIVYTNPSDAPSANTTFTVTVNDQGNTGSSGAQTETASQTITITAVNDPPEVDGVPASVTVLEDVATSLGLSGVSLSDPDHATLTVTLTAGAGTLSGNASGTPFGPQSVVTLDTTPAELQAILATIQYTGAANAAGNNADTVTVEVRDPLGATVTEVIAVNITPVNDAPAGADATLTVVEDTPRTFSAADFGFSDANDTPANGFASVVFTSVPTNGTLALNGTPVTEGRIILATALGNLVYTPNADVNGIGADRFTFQVRDDGGTDNNGENTDPTPNVITIDITPVNDAPSSTDAAVTVVEDTPRVFSVADFGFTDPNDAPANALANVIITTLPASGTLTLNGVAVTASQAIAAGDIGGLVYTPATNVNGPAAASFTFQVQDDGGTANGGVDIDPTRNTITIDITPVNDAPASTDATVTVVEDTPRTFSAADFGFIDPNDAPANALANVIITTLPASGTLTLGGVAVTAGQAIAAADIGSLIYTPAADANGTGVDSFTFQVQDDGSTANGGQDTAPTPNTLTIDITPVNDAPTIAGPAEPISVPPAGIVTLTDLVIGDVDVTTSPAGGYTVTVTVDDGTLAVVTAVSGVTVSGSGTGTLTLAGTLADINAALAGGVAYTAPVVFDPTGVALTATVSDNGNAGLGTALTDTVGVPITVAGDVDPVILATAGDGGTGADPVGVLGQANGDPITTLDNTGGAADPNTDVTPDGGLTGDLAGPAAGDVASLVLFGVPIADVAAGLPPGAELSGFTGAADLLASLNPAAGPDAALTDEIDLELHGFPVEELALFLVGDFELSTLESRDAVLNLVAASTDGATMAERLAVLEMLERLGLFADGSISLAELQGEIGLFGMSLGEMVEALEGVDLDGVTTLSELQAMLGTPSVVEVPTEAGLMVPSAGAPAFTDQLAGAFTAFDRDAAVLGAALAQIGDTRDRLAA